MIETVVALVVYPGVLLTLVLGLIQAELTSGPIRARDALNSLISPGNWKSGEGLMNGISVLLAGVGLAFLPWPFLSAAPSSPATLLLAWGGLEGAFLVALLPGLVAGTPPVVRASIRKAQVGGAGRMLLWLAIGAGLVLHTNWNLWNTAGNSPLLVHLLAGLTALFAFPVAVGWGPFAPERSITPGGVDQGLDSDTLVFVETARTVRNAALLAACLLALLPIGILPAFPGILLLIAGFVAVGVLLKRFEGVRPRLSLPNALSLCWWRALPLALATMVALMSVGL